MMTIGHFSRAGGVGVETVRFYHRRGLLPVPGNVGGVRRYDTDDMRRLRFIRGAQSAGFTLDEIGELLALDATEDRARARALANARIAALDDKITELTAARASLGKLAHLCGSSVDGPCPIISAFEDS